MKNAGKPIYDPIAEREASREAAEVTIGGLKPFDQGDRRTYEVHRPCGHCRGTGRRRDDKSTAVVADPKCSQCLLGGHTRGRQATDRGLVVVWGKAIEALAFELTEAETLALEPDKQMGARYEQGAHDNNRRVARILCEQEEAAKRPEVILTVRNFV